MGRGVLRIGVTMRMAKAPGYDEMRDVIACDWAAWLAVAVPEVAFVYLPNLGRDATPTYAEALGITGLILTGGDDPGVYPRRDDSERALLDWAGAGGLPVLGVCRGLQLMTLAAGGELIEVTGHVATRHAVTGEVSREVNSYHGLGVGDVPPGYRALATDADGAIEAIAHTRLPWEGWMWHPEREATPDPADIARFRQLMGTR